MDFPANPDIITKEWLTDQLQKTGILKESRVSSISVEALDAEKGLTGQLFRLRLGYDIIEVDAPVSLIAKLSSPDPQVRSIIHSMGFYEREVRFYEQLAPISLLRTPRCYFSAIDMAEGLMLLLLEDLGGAQNDNSIAGCSVEEAELAILGIAPFHAQWWGQPSLREKSWLKPGGFMAVDQMQAIFALAWEPFLGLATPFIRDRVLEPGERLKTHYSRITRYLYDGPSWTLVHSDYHADNLFFVAGKNAHLVVADWQITTTGNGVIDVSRFLGGNLSPKDRRDHELRIVRAYNELLVENGIADYTFEQCWNDYRLGLLLALGITAMVVGMSARMYGGPADGGGGPWEVIISRLCHALEDLRVGDLLEDAEAFPI